MQGRRAVVPHAAQPGPHHHGDQAGQPEARTGTVPLLEKYQVPVPFHQFSGPVSFDTGTDPGSKKKNSDPGPVQTLIRIPIQPYFWVRDPVLGKLYESGGSGSETLRTILMGMGLNGSAHVRYVKNIGT